MLLKMLVLITTNKNRLKGVFWKSDDILILLSFIVGWAKSFSYPPYKIFLKLMALKWNLGTRKYISIYLFDFIGLSCYEY